MDRVELLGSVLEREMVCVWERSLCRLSSEGTQRGGCGSSWELVAGSVSLEVSFSDATGSVWGVGYSTAVGEGVGYSTAVGEGVGYSTAVGEGAGYSTAVGEGAGDCSE